MFSWSPKRLDLHIMVVVVVSQWATLAVATLAMWLVLVAFVASDLFQGTSATLVDTLLAAAYQIPRLTVDCLHAITVVGSAFAYAYLSRNNELPIFRAAGISAWRFLAPAGVYGLLTGMIVITSFWQLSGIADGKFVDLANRIQHQKLSQEVTVWLQQRDNEQTTLVRGTKMTPFSDTLENPSFFVLSGKPDAGLKFKKRIDGRFASLQDNKWNIDRTVSYLASGQTNVSDSTTLPSPLTASVLYALGVPENQITFWQYPRYIEARKLAGRSVGKYMYKFHSLFSLPVFLAGMAIIGGLLCARLARFGDLAITTTMAGAVGIAAMFMTSIAYAAADRNLVDPALAAWCPALFFFFLALAAVATAEDG